MEGLGRVLGGEKTQQRFPLERSRLRANAVERRTGFNEKGCG